MWSKRLVMFGIVLVALLFFVVSNKRLLSSTRGDDDQRHRISSSISSVELKREDFRDLSYANRPRIWIVQLLSARQKECQLPRQIASYRLFYNELLFDRILWVVDDDELTLMEALYPYPIVLYKYANKRLRDLCAKLKGSSPDECKQLQSLHLDLLVEEAAKAKGLKPPDVLAIVTPEAYMSTVTTIQTIFPDGGRGIYYSDKKSWTGEAPLRALGVASEAFSGATEYLPNSPQIADFSSSLPIYVYRDTLKKLREKVESTHSRAFLNVFEDVSKANSNHNPYNIILSYAYHFERQRYSFHLQPSKREHKNAPDARPQVQTWLTNATSTSSSPMRKGCCFSYKLFPKDTARCYDYDVTLHYELLHQGDQQSFHNSYNVNNSTLREFYRDVHHLTDLFYSWSVGSKQKLCTAYLDTAFTLPVGCQLRQVGR